MFCGMAGDLGGARVGSARSAGQQPRSQFPGGATVGSDTSAKSAGQQPRSQFPGGATVGSDTSARSAGQQPRYTTQPSFTEPGQSTALLHRLVAYLYYHR